MAAELKTHHLLTLAYLLSRGAVHGHIAVTTTGLGRAIGRSQQAASQHLLDLERGGLVQRSMDGRRTLVRVTAKGHNEARAMASALTESLEASKSRGAELRGTLQSGKGEGSYYMSLAGYVRQFRKKLGYVPYPGTLNVRLRRQEYVDAVAALDSPASGALIDGFADSKRTFGWVRCHAASANGVPCHLIRLERTFHDPFTIELISRTSLRRACRLRDGSAVTVQLRLRES